MKPLAKLAISCGGALVAVPFLPIYVRRSMTRSFRESGGDLISWNWELESIPSFFENMRYLRPEESRYLYLALNLGLCLVYAGLLGFGVWLVWQRATRGKSR
jgi:hypothetical protein